MPAVIVSPEPLGVTVEVVALPVEESFRVPVDPILTLPVIVIGPPVLRVNAVSPDKPNV